MSLPVPDRPPAGELHQPSAPSVLSIPEIAHSGTVELRAEREPVVWVPDAYNRMVPMPKHAAPPPVHPTPPRDLSPLPLLDPIAQRFMGAGIGGGALSAGVGYGVGQVFSSLAGAGSGALLWLLVIGLALRAAPRAAQTHVTQHITAHGFLSRANGTIHNR
ncbi:hypothetical protein ACIGW3_08640 [Streptomyces sp. NPDC053499]|uniref:hypothetical protein n=1 Tax=Streptomyces sp. NPDC053499 TaxID=3365707 RepID=UPI0037D83FC2